MSRRFFEVCVAMAAVLFAPAAQAQIRASERGGVFQVVDGTVITVDYSRPQARKRGNLFGRVVHADEIWTPGANAATTLELSRDIRLNGQPVPAGKYSLWLTTPPGAWVLHLHRKATLFHTQRPALAEMFLSIPVTPIQGEHVEAVSFDFPRVSRDGTTLRFRWGTMAFGVEILVEPSRPKSRLTDEQAAPYVGRYELVFIGKEGAGPEMKMEIVNIQGVLRAIVDGTRPFVIEFLPTEQPHRFMPAFLEDGKIFDVEETPVIFELDGARATGFYSPGVSTEVWMRATRKK